MAVEEENTEDSRATRMKSLAQKASPNFYDIFYRSMTNFSEIYHENDMDRTVPLLQVNSLGKGF